jgi:hypothetical protein
VRETTDPCGRFLDAALVSPGKKTPFPNPDRRPDLRHGMHACLANNIWGTNYVMWQPYGPEGRDMRFRFVLQARGTVRHPLTVLFLISTGSCL